MLYHISSLVEELILWVCHETSGRQYTGNVYLIGGHNIPSFSQSMMMIRMPLRQFGITESQINIYF